MPWRRERLSTPVVWPGEFHGLYSPWGHKELDTTDQFSLSFKNNKNADDTTCMAESEELKSLMMKVKEESGNVSLNSTFRKLRSWYPVPSLHGK